MADLSLQRLLKQETLSLVQGLLSVLEPGLSIQDPEGQVLLGARLEQPAKSYPVRLGNELLGQVIGHDQGLLVAMLLNHLASRQLEIQTLSSELLSSHRELNLLYELAEKVTNCTKVQTVAQLVVEETRRLMPATDAHVLLVDLISRTLEPVSCSSSQMREALSLAFGWVQVSERVIQAGQGVILNAVDLDERFNSLSNPPTALMCVPLKSAGQVLGTVTVSSNGPACYTQDDLRLLTAIATQVAPAIEGIQRQQKQLEEARIRQQVLEQQLQELRAEMAQPERKATEIAEITETDYFQQLQRRARQIRRQIRSDDES